MLKCYDCDAVVPSTAPRMQVAQPFSCGNLRWEWVALCIPHALERLRQGFVVEEPDGAKGGIDIPP